ncbi:MAG: type II secretion system F family protein [Candidatus Aenigmarchaeota archaeon]|nr:type II secretion system F family protein [Candidatus Aenigmarchaeota archaeon]MDI6722449.1 type II secretion system F family protein [Candidatus Aenigmarchaeota archaeon]
MKLPSFRIDLRKNTTSIASILSGIFLIYLNFAFFSLSPQMFSAITLVSGILVIGIPLMIKYSDYKKVKRIETLFPRYLSDIAENISSGMTLPQAIRIAAKNDYDVLTPYVRDINAKISWGIPLEIVMNDFAVKSGSVTMKRNVQTIIETHRSGGSIDIVLKSVAQSLLELERIKKERSSSIYSQMINGYVIYIIFLGVMIGLSSFLIPTFRFNETSADLEKTFVDIFRSLIVIQGFFAGLSIGKLAEGTIQAGIKHSLVLVVVGYSAFLLFG